MRQIFVLLVLSVLYCYFSSVTIHTEAAIALKNLFDPRYPNHCVFNISDRTYIMNVQEKMNFKNLPCTFVACLFHGFGVIYTCDAKSPPFGCVYTNYVNLEADFPLCCEQNLSCD